MEITNIKENMISQSLQESIPERVNKSEQSDQRADRTDGVKGLFKGDSKGDPEAMKSLTDEKINQLAESANQVAESMNHSIQFVVNRDSGKVVINVVDSEGNVICKIPPEALKSTTSGMDANRGLLLNTEL